MGHLRIAESSEPSELKFLEIESWIFPGLSELSVPLEVFGFSVESLVIVGLSVGFLEVFGLSIGSLEGIRLSVCSLEAYALLFSTCHCRVCIL